MENLPNNFSAANHQIKSQDASSVGKKESKELRDKRKTIRFTQKELDTIAEKSSYFNMKFSQYIIFSAVKERVSIEVKKNILYKDLIMQLAKIGNNLNQIARTCNTQKEINNHIVSKLVLVISELQKQLNDISKKIQD